ncbi:MAG: type II toxin-antitoxin system RelE/ParE family toxin [bacterium]
MSEKLFQYDFAEIDGKIEMNIFLNSLTAKDRAKIKAYIDKLVELLNITAFPNTKLSKYLRDGIFELRVNLKNTTSRNLYFFMSDKYIIFTHGFIKKTEKTSENEINKAIRIKEIYKDKK